MAKKEQDHRHTLDLRRQNLEEQREQHEYDLARAEVRQPHLQATRGQALAFGSLVAVLLFCGFLVVRGHVVTAGIIAAFDLIALVGVFITGQVQTSAEEEEEEAERGERRATFGDDDQATS